MISRGVDRRQALGGGFAALAVAVDARAATSADVPLELTGTPMQSGLMIGRTIPLAQIRLDDIDLTADSEGRFVIGFDRDAPSQALLTVTTPQGGRVQRTLFVAHRSYRRSVIRGLPQGTIEPPPEVRARIERESAVKKVAAASIAPGTGFAEPFDWPVPSRRITSPWGAQRVLNGTAQRPHYGVDIGVPAGTPIRAPAPGIVILAEDDYWFEGGVVAIDHGQGLHTMYIHQNKVGATAGQVVARGDVIGEVGAKGRATGPHLCWRMRWRGRQCDPTLRVVAA